MKSVLTRRNLLKSAVTAPVVGAGLAASAAATASNPFEKKEWNQVLGAGVDAEPYGMPSPYEKDVVRHNVEWLTASVESSINFTPLHALDGIITPNGLHFERHHGGVAEVDPAEHRLMIHGLVDKPLVFTIEDLKRMPPMSRFHFLECAANGGMEWRGAQLNGVQFTHGMVACCQYTGVSLRTLLDQVGVKPNGKWILAEGADSAGMNRSIPMDKALDDCMIAYAQNGEALRPSQGYPLRLVVPGFEGNMWVKWIRRLEIGDMPWFAREETSKYTDLLEDGKARMFTWVQDANSVITSPSPEMPVAVKGYQTIKGLAWSGRGTIKGVDVSVDGGKNWQAAQLDQPVLPKCLTRFYLPWQFDGNPSLLQSRAYDDTGYVQPTFAKQREERGYSSIYHNNSIHTWEVKANGEVENVQLS
ncbi:MAG: sulfite dehydrogenase [Alphaproteobacteria bacterium]